MKQYPIAPMYTLQKADHGLLAARDLNWQFFVEIFFAMHEVSDSSWTTKGIIRPYWLLHDDHDDTIRVYWTTEMHAKCYPLIFFKSEEAAMLQLVLRTLAKTYNG